MDDFFQIIIYIIMGAIYLFFSLSGSKDKKKPAKASTKPAQKNLQEILKELKENPPASASRDTSSSFSKKPNTPSEKSLQDLLNEIKAERKVKDLEERAEDFEEDIFDQSFTLDFESGKKADWDSRIKRDHPKRAQEKSDKQPSPKNRPSAYRKLLRDRATLKQAFILSEVFQKKF